jgi:hypothetical protein
VTCDLCIYLSLSLSVYPHTAAHSRAKANQHPIVVHAANLLEPWDTI